VDLRDHYVQFHLADIYLPDPVTLTYELHGNDVVRGKVLEMSDSGEQADAFVVVAVDDVPHRMIVPVNRIVIES
jgi:hypothetical protein